MFVHGRFHRYFCRRVLVECGGRPLYNPVQYFPRCDSPPHTNTPLLPCAHVKVGPVASCLCHGPDSAKVMECSASLCLPGTNHLLPSSMCADLALALLARCFARTPHYSHLPPFSPSPTPLARDVRGCMHAGPILSATRWAEAAPLVLNPSFPNWWSGH